MSLGLSLNLSRWLGIAYCKFVVDNGWSFEILHFNTFNYDSVFRKIAKNTFQNESDIKLSYGWMFDG